MARKKKSMIGVDPLAWLADENKSEHEADESRDSSEAAGVVENETYQDDRNAILVLDEVQDISKSIALKNDIMSMINELDMLTINAEKVDRIDGSAIQILCSLFTYAKNNNLMIAWFNPSDVLLKAAEITGVKDLLELSEY